MSDVSAPTATGSPRLPGVGRALVVGLGVSGRAAADALLDAGVRVTAVDEQTAAEGAAAVRARGADVVVRARPEEHLTDADVVVLSPGVPDSAPVVAAAAARGLPVWSEPELAWRLHRPAGMVGITGTNGKTSVTELTAAILAADGRDAVACGNIGTPLVAAAAGAAPGSLLVAELSSFQLRFSHRLRPVVGVLLNVAADHLDWHGDVGRYARAKARLWRAQGSDDWAVVNADDDTAVELARSHAPGRVALFSGRRAVGTPGVGVRGGTLVADLPGLRAELLDLEDLARQAPHHRANVAAAALAALLAGADPAAVGRAARTFTPGHHRVETVVERDGVRWVDDSKATNPHAAAASLAAFDDVVWIAGGTAKGVDLSALGPRLGSVRHAVLLGEAAGALAAVCSGSGVPVTRVDSMAGAVSAAHGAARPGDTVLLAPACASFDMFEDYRDRGRQFAEAVAALEGEGDG